MKMNEEKVKAQGPEVPRNINDRLFRRIFGDNDHREWTLSLYNAINGSSYTNPEEITITTIEDVVYLSMKNDVSFLIADTMSFYEQQSTFNPNMPVRMLIYAGLVYSSYTKVNGINVYSPILKHLPVPRMVCFYNGKDEKADRSVLCLSDAFGGKDRNPDIEVTVLMLNINYGRNKELMRNCRPLGEYSLFIESVRKYIKEDPDRSRAVSRAIRDLPEDSELRRFLEAHEAEVSEMCLTEYDEKEEREQLSQEFREIGQIEGRKEGEQRLGALMSQLLSLGKTEEAMKASSDSEYRNQLYKQYNL